MDALSRLPGVDVLRAPYEADAQLAFLARANLVHAVLTEDSDLVAYCLPRVLFKFDRQNATAQLIEKQRLMEVSVPGFSLKGFTDEMFLQMCILSGVDYLDSPKGLGLKTANSLVSWLKDGQRVIKHLKACAHKSKKYQVDPLLLLHLHLHLHASTSTPPSPHLPLQHLLRLLPPPPTPLITTPPSSPPPTSTTRCPPTTPTSSGSPWPLFTTSVSGARTQAPSCPSRLSRCRRRLPALPPPLPPPRRRLR